MARLLKWVPAVMHPAPHSIAMTALLAALVTGQPARAAVMDRYAARCEDSALVSSYLSAPYSGPAALHPNALENARRGPRRSAAKPTTPEPAKKSQSLWLAQVPQFKGGVDLVRVTAVVKDRRGRAVTDLTPQDFVLLDGGQRKRITDIRAGEGDIAIGLLLDVSGSMRVAKRMDAARQAADQLLSWLAPRRDEVAVFTFDQQLRQVTGFTTDLMDVRRALRAAQPYGTTSLRDAIADAAKEVATGGRARRALVVLTDGVDTSSRLTPSEVSGIASAIDVPVYVLAVVSPLDNPAEEIAVERTSGGPSKLLTQLAEWTGGDLFISSTAAHASAAARQIVSELRHQYLITFEPSAKPGWHALEVRTRDRDFVVRARSGYIAGPARPVS